MKAFIASLLGKLGLVRTDALLAGLLLAGGFGFGNSYSWLPPESSAPQASALLAQTPVAPPQMTGVPKLALGKDTDGHGLAAPAFAPLQGFSGRGFGGGNGGGLPGGEVADSAHDPIHQYIGTPKGIALGNAATPLAGGFAAVRSAPAVPEPSTWALIALGGAMIGFQTLRSRRRAMA